jgi:hypothetical protein
VSVVATGRGLRRHARARVELAAGLGQKAASRRTKLKMWSRGRKKEGRKKVFIVRRRRLLGGDRTSGGSFGSGGREEQCCSTTVLDVGDTKRCKSRDSLRPKRPKQHHPANHRNTRWTRLNRAAAAREESRDIFAKYADGSRATRSPLLQLSSRVCNASIGLQTRFLRPQVRGDMFRFYGCKPA